MNLQARLVIVGAGIVGCAAAYHLTKLGWRDIIVLDKGPIFENDGSTSHAPGTVVALSHSKLLTQMAQYSSKLYKQLQPFKGERNTYNALGGLDIASSQQRMEEFIRLQGEADAFGTEAVLQTPEEIQEKVPLINRDDLVGDCTFRWELRWPAGTCRPHLRGMRSIAGAQNLCPTHG